MSAGDWDGVALVVPYSNEQGCEWRERALARVREWWSPFLPLTTYSAERDGQWSKGASIILGARAQQHARVIIMADADVLPDPTAVTAALRTIRRGDRWIIPQSTVQRLSPAGTLAVIDDSEAPELAETDYVHRAMACGGLVIMTRETLLRCPPDPRFVGWGNEDESWAIALRTLAGVPRRLPYVLPHLWHPRAPRISPWLGSVESGKLRDRYLAARRRPVEMEALISEYRDEAIDR